MKLRSRTPGASSSSKGKEKLKYNESSDEDDFGAAVSSDSDYNALSEDGEDLLDVLDDNGGGETLDLNFALGAALEDSDDDLLDNVPKRRKPYSRKTKGEESRVQEGREEEGEREMGGVTETEALNNLNESVFNVALKQKNGRKKKSSKKKDDRPVLMWEILEEENERWVAENLEKDLDLVNQNEMATETLEPSDDLIIPLLRYQKEWLAWALKQEESAVRGGILADEMGMGKTLQAISLVLLKRKILREFSGHELHSPSVSSARDLPAIKGTLVICPLVAVMQWVSEIERFTSKGSTKVLVYHGANRAKNHYRFSEYDFVITTYSIVEAEYRKYVMPPKEKCQYCGKLFYEHKLKIHLRYFCGPGAIRTAKQSKQQKKEPKQKIVAGSTSDAGAKEGKMSDLGEKEMEHLSSTRKSILHSVVWERVILDEVKFFSISLRKSISVVIYHFYLMHPC